MLEWGRSRSERFFPKSTIELVLATRGPLDSDVLALFALLVGLVFRVLKVLLDRGLLHPLDGLGGTGGRFIEVLQALGDDEVQQVREGLPMFPSGLGRTSASLLAEAPDGHDQYVFPSVLDPEGRVRGVEAHMMALRMSS